MLDEKMAIKEALLPARIINFSAPIITVNVFTIQKTTRYKYRFNDGILSVTKFITTDRLFLCLYEELC